MDITPSASELILQIPQELEGWRKMIGVSPSRFAKEYLGISHSTYQRWLAGRFNPNLRTVMRVEELLEIWDFCPPVLNAQTAPLLAEIWDNPQDAIYDDL
ncbi:helix-turn-helix transcriptional regulator [bacterium]|nr:helix-turn-helix transcriptional regulator [bacterium]